MDSKDKSQTEVYRLVIWESARPDKENSKDIILDRFPSHRMLFIVFCDIKTTAMTNFIQRIQK